MNGKKILSSLAVISGSQFLAYGLSFLRNVILARMLTQADFGLAAVFVLTVTMMELTSRMALGRQVIQAVEGDSQKFLNTAHTFQLLAGAISAVFLTFLCGPVAYLFKVPDKTWAFALLALVPLLRGLENLDFQRRQRNFEFLPAFWVELVPQVIVTTLAWPLIKWIGDFRVVLVLILTKSTLTMLMTHLMALRPYRWAWDKMFARRMWHFSWPLIINGLLMYASHQGDKLLVGTGFSLKVLALYSAAVMFTSVPYMIMAQVAGSLTLPLLAHVQGKIILFNREYKACLEISAIVAVAAMIPLIIGGEQILRLFFGLKYSGGGILMSWLAAACAFRFLLIIPATAAIARADTKNNMLTNLFRSSSLVTGLVVIALGGAVELVAVCMFFGELVALFGSSWLLKRRLGIPQSGAIKAAGYVFISLSVAGLFVLLGSGDWALPVIFGISLILIISCLFIAWWLFPENTLRLWKMLRDSLKLS